MKHNPNRCGGVLCESDPTPNWKHWVTWYPDEPMCGKTPYSKIQKTQAKIQRFYKGGKLKHGNQLFFTGEMLERLYRVESTVRGRTPNGYLKQ